LLAEQNDKMPRSDFASWLGKLHARVQQGPRFRRLGTVREVVGLTMVSQGPPAQLGETCFIKPTTGSGAVRAQVVGFRDNRLLLMPLGEVRGIEPGCPVVAEGEQLAVPVGQELLGRVVDGFGQPIDGKGPLHCNSRRAVYATAPLLVDRVRVAEPMYLGIRAVDALLTCGKGQRIGIFAGSGIGKSVLLAMIARNSSADINVIALVGERGREVLDFVEEKLGPALDRSVVVAATSDQPALVRLQAGFAATAIAEDFRDQGAHVMLMMDSITRLARAQREVGLAAGEMPANRGYPPSVFAMIPTLVERAGPSATGTITGIYTVLVEGDDMLEPVADTLRATLDGQIVLSRDLAQKGQYPAIDVTVSVSRLMTDVVDSRHRELAGKCRRLMKSYEDIADLVAVGAYEPGGDAWVDAAVQVAPDIAQFLRQDLQEHSDIAEALEELSRIVDKAGQITASR